MTEKHPSSTLGQPLASVFRTVCVLAKTFLAPSLVNFTQAFSRSVAVASLTKLLARVSRTSVCRGSFFFRKSFFTIFFRGDRTIFWREDLQVASCFHPPAMPVNYDFRVSLRNPCNLSPTWHAFVNVRLNQLTSDSRCWLFWKACKWPSKLWLLALLARERESARGIRRSKYPIARSKLTYSLDSALNADSYCRGPITKIFFSFLARPTSSWVIRSSKQKHETRSTVPQNWTFCKFRGAWSNWKKKTLALALALALSLSLSRSCPRSRSLTRARSLALALALALALTLSLALALSLLPSLSPSLSLSRSRSRSLALAFSGSLAPSYSPSLQGYEIGYASFFLVL